MKRVLVLFLLTVSFIYGKGVIESDVLNLYLKNGVLLKMNESEDGELRVNVFKNENVESSENEFFINKKKSNKPIKKLDDLFKVGDYYIKELENGYSVYGKDYSLFYSSDFKYQRGKFFEYKRCWNQKIFHGMGEAAYQNSIQRMRMKIHQISEYGDQAQLYIPFYFTDRGDAFYYNANNNDLFKFGREGNAEISYYPEKDYYDYYFYHNDNLKELVANFYDFSDSKSLLPKWAFGYIQSKYGYENEEEVYDLIKEFKKRDIPLSAIVLDLQWFKKMGDLDWNSNAWSDPKKMDRYLEDNGVKLITISEPFFTFDSKNYKEFEKEGIFAMNKNGEPVKWNSWWCFGADYGSIANPIAENAKKVWGKKYIDMKKTGIDGYWTDLGEPEATPTEAMFNQYSEEEFHNYYNRAWSKMVYEAHNEAFPNERLFNMTRSGYTGSGKYNVSVWSGDSGSSFTILKKQVGIGLNGGVSGFSYWGSDVGGFASGGKKPERELFIRWMQFGAFTPIFRAHGSMSPREPWIHDEEATEIISSYIKLRYEMLPYIYSTAYETYEDGTPIMRGLYLENSGDRESSRRRHEFYFGDYILVSPVFDKLEKRTKQEVYLPQKNWYDFYTYEKYEAGKHTVDIDINKIPIFIEEGAILPFESALNLFPKADGESSFELYNDDGISNEYLKGDFEKVIINLKKDCLELNNLKEAREIKVKLFKENVKIENLKDYSEDDHFYIFNLNLNQGDNKILF